MHNFDMINVFKFDWMSINVSGSSFMESKI